MTSNKQNIVLLNGELKIRPYVDNEQLKEIVLQCFGLELDGDSEPVEMVSYDDRNFRIKGKLKGQDETKQFVLKIFNSGSASKGVLESVVKLMSHCASKSMGGFAVQTPVPSIKSNGEDAPQFIASYHIPVLGEACYDGCTKEKLINKGLLSVGENNVVTCSHDIRLVTFLEGKVPDYSKENCSDTFAEDTGRTCANLCNAMLDVPQFKDVDRTGWIWDLLSCGKILKNSCLNVIKDMALKKVLEDVINEFESKTIPELDKHFTKSYIHGDLNEQNLLISNEDKVAGILDFDDVVWSYPVIDLATSMMYLSVGCSEKDMIHKLNMMYKGYNSIRKLSEVEKSLLFNICLMRYAQSTSVSIYQHEVIDPTNDYLLLHTKNNFQKMSFLIGLGPDEFMKRVCSE
ncbi:hydroxylysine kinase-like [Clytia hemisphaerica]